LGTRLTAHGVIADPILLLRIQEVPADGHWTAAVSRYPHHLGRIKCVIVLIHPARVDMSRDPKELSPTGPGDQTGVVRAPRASAPRTRLLLGAVLAVSMGALVIQALLPADGLLSPQDVDEIVAGRLASATVPVAQSAQVYRLILPSLVLIQTRREVADSDRMSGIGTGIVVNTAGQILTARHVVADADRIDLTFADGSTSAAAIIIEDPGRDIAVLQPLVLPDLIVPAVLGTSAGVRIGDEAYAVGNPLGLVGSISAGVISGLDRSYALEGGERRLEGLIQFDAAVNPGNSGGPLLNRNGQVIGIVTSLANPSGQDVFIGIGFAVPIAAAGGAAGAPDY